MIVRHIGIFNNAPDVKRRNVRAAFMRYRLNGFKNGNRIFFIDVYSRLNRRNHRNRIADAEKNCRRNKHKQDDKARSILFVVHYKTLGTVSPPNLPPLSCRRLPLLVKSRERR